MTGERWLTTRTVDALGVGEVTLFRDRGLDGFGVRVEPSGRKIYAVRLGAKGWVEVGRHGEISTGAARRRAAALIAGSSAAEPRPEPTLAEAASRYVREYVEVRCKPATVAQYRIVLERHILPALGGTAVAAVGRAQAAALQHRLSDRPAMANQAVAILGRLLDHAADSGLVPPGRNPCRGLRKYRARRRERFLTEPEFRRLGEALDALEAERAIAPQAAAAIRLLALTGCRRNEILTLRWEDVRLGESELRLRDSKTGPRTVPLSPAAARVLAEMPRIPGNPWVVPGAGPGAPISGIFPQWRRARERAGLDDLRLHDLRHSFASRALALGESLPAIAVLLGHARVQSTARYAHLSRDAVSEAAARLAADIGADILPGAAGKAPGGGANGAGRGRPSRAAARASAKRVAACIGADILPR